ncbi:adenylate/guanylate cyclase domain-containing protein [Vogesella fluminis]|uniref:Adenylate/guanylate cyclase domain-containing protein n=3 Tax=Vogesella fluminis TaxID=1069161 RepID=A0ABQ3HEG3_9NEIS|nr:adenylate/guanylate cyclase domain-containing protein [Vogesella fluminis]
MILYLSLGYLGQGMIHSWRERLNDTQWLILPQKETGDSVVIVDIDDISLGVIGNWPWPRQRIIELVEKLFKDYQTSTVGLDILYAEPSANTSVDEYFGSLGYKYPLVFSQVFSLSDNSTNTTEAVLSGGMNCPVGINIQDSNGYVGISKSFGNIPHAGHISPKVDADGLIRSFIPLIKYNGVCYPSLALSMFDVTIDNKKESKWLLKNGKLVHSQSEAVLPIDNSGVSRLNFTIKPAPQYSANLVFDNSLPKEFLKNKIVIIGSSATGLGDLISIPTDSRISGVQVHAFVLNMLLQQNNPERPQWTILITFLVLLIICWGIFSIEKSGFKNIKALLCFALLWILASYILWEKNIDLPVLPIISSIIILLPINIFLQKVAAQISEGIMLLQLSAYIPKEVLVQLIESGDDPRKIQAKNIEITVMFADIKNFSKITEEMPPIKVALLLNLFMDFMEKKIHQHNGIIDKFIGDAVMAIWGAPLNNKYHANDAVSCAIDIQNNISELNEKLIEKELPEIEVTIGINTGHSAVGNMGSENRKSYTAVGSSVNIAARLQDSCRHFDVGILISEETSKNLINKKLIWHGALKIKGHEKEINVCTPEVK